MLLNRLFFFQSSHQMRCLVFLMYMSRWFIHHLYESFNEQHLLNSFCVSRSPKQLKWHHLKQFTSFQKAPSGTTKVCTQLLFHTCTHVLILPKPVNSLWCVNPVDFIIPLNPSNICTSVAPVSLFPFSLFCTLSHLFFLYMFAHVKGGFLYLLQVCFQEIMLRACFFLFYRCAWKSQWTIVSFRKKKDM